eukprot:3746661-Amphidinium_carterae.1
MFQTPPPTYEPSQETASQRCQTLQDTYLTLFGLGGFGGIVFLEGHSPWESPNSPVTVLSIIWVAIRRGPVEGWEVLSAGCTSQQRDSHESCSRRGHMLRI